MAKLFILSRKMILLLETKASLATICVCVQKSECLNIFFTEEAQRSKVPKIIIKRSIRKKIQSKNVILETESGSYTNEMQTPHNEYEESNEETSSYECQLKPNESSSSGSDLGESSTSDSSSIDSNSSDTSSNGLNLCEANVSEINERDDLNENANVNLNLNPILSESSSIRSGLRESNLSEMSNKENISENISLNLNLNSNLVLNPKEKIKKNVNISKIKQSKKVEKRLMLYMAQESSILGKHADEFFEKSEEEILRKVKYMNHATRFV